MKLTEPVATNDGILLLQEIEEMVGSKKQKPNDLPIDWELVRDASWPLLISTAGLILTGVLFDWVQHWRVFTSLTELFIIVPIVFNVKGNIEMSLGSRLSTAANLGHFEAATARKELVRSNLMLVLFQSLICGFVVGISGSLLGLLVHRGRNGWIEELVIVASSVFTCAASSVITCGILVLIIWFSHKWSLANPDNIASPIASSLGDFTTLALLSIFSHLFFHTRSLLLLIATLVIACVLFVFSAYYLIYEDSHGLSVIVTSTPPLLFSLGLTSMSGLILERYTLELPGLAFLLPVTSGICNNFSAIYASRLSTNLIDPEVPEITVRNRKTIFTMTCMNIAVQALLLLFIHLFGVAHFRLGKALIGVCLGTSTTCLLMVLCFVRPLSKWLHAHNFDLHSYSIPVLSAFGDLLGALFLIIAMLMLL